MQDLLAGSIGNIELKVIAEIFTLPERQGLRVFLIIAIGDEGVAHAQSARHVTNQRWKEIAPSCRSRADHDRAESLFGEVAFGHIPHHSNDADHVAVWAAMGSEDAGFPHVVTTG